MFLVWKRVVELCASGVTDDGKYSQQNSPLQSDEPNRSKKVKILIILQKLIKHLTQNSLKMPVVITLYVFFSRSSDKVPIAQQFHE